MQNYFLSQRQSMEVFLHVFFSNFVEIGGFVILFGFAFLFLGVLLFFDRGLLGVGNVGFSFSKYFLERVLIS